MADPFAGFTDKGPQAPAPQADPWAGWRDAGPGSQADEGPTFAERATGAFDRSSYRPTPTKLGDLMQEREVPEPGDGKSFLGSVGNLSLGSIRDTLRKSSDITQRARNTAFGTGPGSVGGIPGVALPMGLEGLAPIASTVAKGAAAATKQLPTTALAATAGYVASHFGEEPEWVKEFIHNLLLHVQLSAGGKK